VVLDDPGVVVVTGFEVVVVEDEGGGVGKQSSMAVMYEVDPQEVGQAVLRTLVVPTGGQPHFCVTGLISRQAKTVQVAN